MVMMESQISLKSGDTAPDFELVGIDNHKHSLKDYAGKKATLIIFMCNHCPFVKAKVEAIKEIHARFRQDVNVIGINSNDSVKYPDDSFENMKIVAEEKKIQFDYLVDESQDIAKKYGATCTPDPFLFDKDFKLIFHGKIDNAVKSEDIVTQKTMINNIIKFLDGKSIEKDFDPSIGCSIKWKE